jgi:predicted peptidase
MRKLIVLVALLYFTASFGYGDTVYLDNGCKIHGDVVKETDESIVLRTYNGIEAEIGQDSIVKIERGKSPFEQAWKEFQEQLDNLPPKDADGYYRLALFCKQWSFSREAQKLFQKVIEIDSDHAAARKKLGYERFEGKWIKSSERKAGESEVAKSSAAKIKPLTSKRKAHLEKLIARYFKEESNRDSIIDEIKKNDAIPTSIVKHFSQFTFKQAKGGLKVTEGESTFRHPKYGGLIYVKRGGNVKEMLPLFVALHGGGKGSGHWSFAKKAWLGRVEKRFKNFVFFAPTVLQKNFAEWAGRSVEEAYVQEVIKAIKRTYNVDTNRIYMAGYSMGGYGTWHVGGHEADVFAGLCSGAGGMLILRGESWGKGIIANLMHTPIVSLHGSSDRPAPVWSDRKANEIMNGLQKKHKGCYVHKYMEFPGGHQAAGQGINSALDWLFKYKRKPYPKKVVWEPKRKFNKYFYWLKVNEPKIGQRIEAEIKGNTIDLTTEDLDSGFSVFLNDELVDLSKPVVVKINGTILFKGMVIPSVSAIVETVADKIDENMWFCARIDF